MKRLLSVIMGCLLAGAACAGGARAARERVEASMVVTGTIGVTPQGTVLGYTLDHPEKLPPVVVQVVGNSVPHWTFEPVLRDGKPVAAKAKMNLRVVARSLGGGRFQVDLRGAYFGDQSTGMQEVRAAPPRYPADAIRSRVDGTVYLALRIDRAGNVADAIAQQVNLRVLGDAPELEHWRKRLADASLKAARQWTFTPADASDRETYRVARVPVDYRLVGGPGSSLPRAPGYGQWETYVPGPVEIVPWFDGDKMLTGAADALPGDGVYGPSQLSLLTPLDHG